MFFAPSNGPTSIVCGQQDCWHAASIAPEFWALEIVTTTVMALKDQHFRKDHCILASAAELVSILILGTALCHMSDPIVGLGLLRGSKRPCQGLNAMDACLALSAVITGLRREVRRPPLRQKPGKGESQGQGQGESQGCGGELHSRAHHAHWLHLDEI